MNYKERIAADPDIMLGKPVIKGTRITVEIILKKLAARYNNQRIVGGLSPHNSGRHISHIMVFSRGHINGGIDCLLIL